VGINLKRTISPSLSYAGLLLVTLLSLLNTIYLSLLILTNYSTNNCYIPEAIFAGSGCSISDRQKS